MSIGGVGGVWSECAGGLMRRASREREMIEGREVGNVNQSRGDLNLSPNLYQLQNNL